MAEQVQQTTRERQVSSDVNGVRSSQAIDDEVATTTQSTVVTGSSLAARIVWFIAGVLLTILALRFVLVLLGANRTNGFADFVYSISHPFAAPFFSLFNYDLNYGVSHFELSTLVAMAVYALVAYGIAKLVTIRHA